MRNIFASSVSDKGLIFRIYRELIKFSNNSKKTVQFKMGKGLE